MLSKDKTKKYIYLMFFIFGKLFAPFRYIYKFLCIMVDYIYTGSLSRTITVSKGSIVRYPAIRIEGKGISIGQDSYIGKYAVITTWRVERFSRPQILIGEGTNIGQNCHITAINRIMIGNNVLTGKYVTITDNSHGSITLDDMICNPNKRKLTSKGPVVIEDNVWIGDKVTICPNVKVGEGSIIGANAVVTKDIPPYSVAVGNPVKIVKNLQ